MRHKIYKSIPNWMVSSVKNSNCNRCDENLVKEDILGIGLKEIEPGKHILFVEYKCHSCDHAARINFSSQTVTIEGLCYLLLEEMQKKKMLEKSKQLPKGLKSIHKKTDSIGEKEVQEFLKNMDAVETFDEFLKLIKAPVIPETENDED